MKKIKIKPKTRNKQKKRIWKIRGKSYSFNLDKFKLNKSMENIKKKPKPIKKITRNRIKVDILSEDE